MDDLDYIKDKVKIIDLCKQAGLKVYNGDKISCIFHREKTPSLSINIKDNYFKCFGCGKSGSVIDFYIQLYHKDLPVTIEDLKQIAGLDSNKLVKKENIRSTAQIPPNYIRPAIDMARVKECLSNDELYLLDERLGIELESDDETSIEASNKAAFRAG